MNEAPELKIYAHYINQLLAEHTVEGLADLLKVSRLSIYRWHGGVCTPHPKHRVDILNLSKVTVSQVRAWWNFW